MKSARAFVVHTPAGYGRHMDNRDDRRILLGVVITDFTISKGLFKRNLLKTLNYHGYSSYNKLRIIVFLG